MRFDSSLATNNILLEQLKEYWMSSREPLTGIHGCARAENK